YSTRALSTDPARAAATTGARSTFGALGGAGAASGGSRCATGRGTWACRTSGRSTRRGRGRSPSGGRNGRGGERARRGGCPCRLHRRGGRRLRRRVVPAGPDQGPDDPQAAGRITRLQFAGNLQGELRPKTPIVAFGIGVLLSR